VNGRYLHNKAFLLSLLNVQVLWLAGCCQILIAHLMPPCLDIYTATSDRSIACIDRFLAQYANLSIGRLRNDFEVFLEDSENTLLTGTLVDTLVYGVAQANRCFALYFKSNRPEFNHVMLYFSRYGHLLLGLSVESFTASGLLNTVVAEAVLSTLKAEFNTQLGLYGHELAPADADDQLIVAFPQLI
jgi:hypothetical protein